MIRSVQRRHLIIGLISAFAAAIWAFEIARPHWAGNASFLDTFEATLVDLRFSSFGPITPPNNVVIVAIDDATLADGQGIGPQSRNRLAKIIDAIGQTRPKVVAVDVLLLDPGLAQSDSALRDALAKVPSVIAAAGSFTNQAAGVGLPKAQDELWPQDMFAADSEIGLANIVTDVNGTPRHIPLLFLTSRGVQLSLTLQAAKLYTGVEPALSAEKLQLGPYSIPLDFGFHLPIRIAGPTTTIETVSAKDILEGRQLDRLTGKAVILGFTATGLGDRFATPFDGNTPGVEIVATAVSQLIGNDPLRRDTNIRLIDAGVAIVLAALCTFAVLMLPLLWGGSLASGLFALWMAAIWLAFPMGLWLSAALPIATIFPPVILAAFYRHLLEKRSAAKAENAVAELKRFQSPVLAEMIADGAGFLKKPETRTLTILFIDLSGFTTLSQTLGASKTQDFLKIFHTLITQTVHQHQGIVFNYMGDGAMVIFGLADQSAHPVDDAMSTAFQLVDKIKSLGVEQKFKAPLGCRIGLHTGPVILSRLGHDEHQQVSVTGDNVNLASRLMEIAKAETASIAATSEFLLAMHSEPVPEADQVKILQVRGRAGDAKVSLWSV